MNPYVVFAVFGAIIAALWFFAWLDPDRRIREAFEAAQVPFVGDELAVARAVGVDRTAPLYESAADVQTRDLAAEVEAWLAGETA